MALIGLGPKGLFALERLLDHACRLDPDVRVAVDLFEPHPSPGAGPVYDPAQPGYLRMNFAAGQLDMWWPSSRAVPSGQRKPFLAWTGGRDADAYPPRAEVGRYLSAGFEAVLRHAPPNVDVRLLPLAAEAAVPDGDGWIVRAGGTAHAYDEVLLAVGHGHSVFPFDRDELAAVAPGATVAIRGFALTFLDTALALTEGRGGSFEQIDHPFRLRYHAGSGEPAVMIPFTRSGRPMLAKPPASLTARVPALGRIAADGRTRIADLGGAVDLHADLLPVLGTIVCANLAAAARCEIDATLRIAVGRRLAEAAGGVGAFAEVDVVPAIERSLLVGAGLAPPDVAWALGHTWRTLYPAIVARLGGDGLPARDWPAFLRLAAELERVAFGPPAINAAKLLALVEAGRIDLGNLRGATLRRGAAGIELRSPHGARAVDVALDAVLPGPGAAGAEGLVSDLIAAGCARVAPGRRGLEVTPDGSCRGRDGAVTRGLSAIGRPTEDSVIGNDTLTRSLHPHADRWARRIVQRSRECYLASARRAAPKAVLA